MNVSMIKIREIINEALDQFTTKQKINIFVYQLLSEMTQKKPEEFMDIIADDKELHKSIELLSNEIINEINKINKTGGKSGFYQRIVK